MVIPDYLLMEIPRLRLVDCMEPAALSFHSEALDVGGWEGWMT